MRRVSKIALMALFGAGSITGQAQAAMDGIFAFDQWHLNKTSQTSNAHAEQNGTDGFTLFGNTSGIGRRSNDRFSANTKSIGNISGTLTVTRTAPQRFQYSFDGSGPAFNLSYDYRYQTIEKDGSQFDGASCLGCASIFRATPGNVSGHVDFKSTNSNSYGGFVSAFGGSNLNLNLF